MGPKWIPIEEAIADIESDPEVHARRKATLDAREKQLIRLREASKALIDDLAAIGVQVPDLGALHHHSPLSPEVVAVLLDWLRADVEELLLEEILIKLRKPKKTFDGRRLAALFESTTSQAVRFEVGVTMELARPTGLEEWVISAINDSSYGDTRISLAVAAAKMAPQDKANMALLQIFDLHPYTVCQALGISGGPTELRFLAERAEKVKGNARKDIERAIKKIKKRLG
ncbi:hypothetical protein D3C72_356140 [compost metagenome]